MSAHILRIVGAAAAMACFTTFSHHALASVSNGGVDFEIEAPLGGDSVWIGPTDQFSIMQGSYVMLGTSTRAGTLRLRSPTSH